MNIEKFVTDSGLSHLSVGLGGCRTIPDLSFESCSYDVVVFDQSQAGPDIVKYGNESVTIHHASFSDIPPRRLLEYAQLQIICDESWDLHMLRSKLRKNLPLLFTDFAKNCLIESQFCSQRTKQLVKTSPVFASCWQKCAIIHLASAILSVNHQYYSPSHMLALLRGLPDTPINQHISTITQTVGFERASTTSLLRMLKSTIGFSELVGNDHNHSKIIQQKYDFFVKNSMFSDCYLYLCCTNQINFTSIKDTLHRNEDLSYILTTAFDVEGDLSLLLHHANLLEESCRSILRTLSDI